MGLLPDRAVIRVSGDDTEKLLDDTLTGRFQGPMGLEGRWFALLSPQGKIQIEGIATEADAATWLDIPKVSAEAFLKRMKLYRLRAKVEFADMSEEVAVWWEAGNEPPTTDLRHEGYNGWTAQAFVTRKGPKPRTGYYVPAETASPFLYEQQNGESRLDFRQYCRDLNHGAAPDFVFIQVGGNDIWRATDSDIDKTIDGVFSYFVIKGLQGAADANHDGVVDADELIKYVSEQVPMATMNKQHPREFGTYDNMMRLSDTKKKGIDMAHWRVLMDARNGGPLFLAGAPQNQIPTTAQAQAAVDRFRAFLGDNNGVGGTFPDGRREINWDGVPDAFSAPNNLPANFFNANSPRGAVFFTPGTGFQVSADSDNPTHTRVEFGNIKGFLPRIFRTFSPERLFTALDSNITEVLFFVPGTPIPATVDGFGAVFTDVNRANITKIEYFDVNGSLLFSRSVPPGTTTRESLSFLGVGFDEDERVFLVRITSGNVLLSPKKGLVPSNGHVRDIVVMDDFIYGEPQAQP